MGKWIDCFEPIRAYVTIESKLAMINNWLVAHTFDKYVQKDKCWDSDLRKIMDREVHFKTAADLVCKTWDLEDITSISAIIKS